MHGEPSNGRHGQGGTVRTALLAAALLAGLWAGEARAYIDPGAGSYVFQLLIAFFVSAIFVLKSYWRRLGAFIKRLFTGKRDEPHEP